MTDEDTFGKKPDPLPGFDLDLYNNEQKHQLKKEKEQQYQLPTYDSAEAATKHFEEFMAKLKTDTVAPVQSFSSKEYDYLDYEQNEKRLQELRNNELARYKNLLEEDIDVKPKANIREEIFPEQTSDLPAAFKNVPAAITGKKAGPIQIKIGGPPKREKKVDELDLAFKNLNMMLEK